MNADLSQEFLKQCNALGVRNFIVCAGSRNSPLVLELLASKNIHVENFFEERSAAFYALGVAKRLHAPVAVVTTSGTAAAELFPALIEAHYSALPLLAVTADLPHAFALSGAPQSIEQKNLYGSYVEHCWDATEPADLRIEKWTQQGPLHVNLRFREPLVPERIRGLDFSCSHKPFVAPKVETSSETEKLLQRFHQEARSPVVILGGLKPHERNTVKELCLKLQLPIYAEAHSGLREDPDLAPYLLRSGENILRLGLTQSVLRLGSVPTLRFWRDLETQYRDLPVFSMSSQPFPGLTRGHFVQSNFSTLPVEKSIRIGASNALLTFDQWYQEMKLELFAAYPRSEAALVHKLSRKLQPHTNLFLGNSLAIRHWDFAADFKPKSFNIHSNRGANGIDGELSTFFGTCKANCNNAALVGDLTALYDLTAPWALRKRRDCPYTLFILNNFGGKIFSGLKHFQEQLTVETREDMIENSHDLSFESWAQFWNLGYERWNDIPSFDVAAKQGIVEINPDLQADREFKKSFEAAWQDAAIKIAQEVRNA